MGSEQLQLQSVAEPAEGGYLAVVQDMSEEPTSTDLRRKEDLASSLISSEMPYGTETVRWPNGQVTVLPTVMLNGRNVLENDAKRVRQMAALPISLPTSPRVDHIDAAALQGGDLRNRVAAALRDDRCAVVRRAAEPGPEKLTLQYLHDEFGISDRLCSLHGQLKHICATPYSLLR